MDRIYVREGDGLFLGAIKLVFFGPLLAVPIYAAVGGWNALTALHWHPALIVLAAFVAIGVITAILTALASALPRTTTAIGVLTARPCMALPLMPSPTTRSGPQ
jgi:hypothetical protein